MSRTNLSRDFFCRATLVVVAVCTLGAGPPVEGQLHWRSDKKEGMRVRIIALAQAYPRTSFFSNHEVFVAEKQLGSDESRLVKLVYAFLPYQPRLSDSGLDYATVHEMHAVRDPDCDEALSRIVAGANAPDWTTSVHEPSDPPDELAAPKEPNVPRQGPSPADAPFKYATGSPVLDLERRHANLPCYATSADDYEKGVHEPATVPGP